MKFILRKSSNRQWYFTIHASNGLILASSETYHNRQDCVNAGFLIKNGASGAGFQEAEAA